MDANRSTGGYRATSNPSAPTPSLWNNESMGSELNTGFACSICGLHHDVLPLSFSVKAPLAAARIPPSQLEHRVVITPDQCVIDDQAFYLRGRIPVPIIGLAEPFIWGVWAEVSPKNFLRTIEMWNSPGREDEPPFPGWLDTELFLFGDTINLPLTVQTQVVGRRPHFTVSDADHPLAIEQRNGITLHRVEQIAAQILHAADANPANPAHD
jgi:hypothetical protein